MKHAPRSLMTILAIGLCTLGLTDASSAQSACEGLRLTASDGATYESFGYSVAVSGDDALVGAQWDGSGSVYVMRRNSTTWDEVQKLLASDGQWGDDFGHSVAMDGDVALIGAGHVHDDGPNIAYGAAYVFRFNGVAWAEEQELLASDSASQDAFGWSVSVSGDVAVIGAWGDDDDGHGSGSAYVFRFDRDSAEWVEEIKLTASDAAAADNFGGSVAISTDPPGRIIVGAGGNSDACPKDPICNSGAAYIFRFDPGTSQWIEEQKLLASDAEYDDGFGSSVSISADVALIGARWDDTAGTDAGSAYVFRFDGSSWVQEQELLVADPWTWNVQQFGRAVAVDGDTAVIGAWTADAVGPDSGAAYVFRFDARNSQWVEQELLLPDSNPWTNFFGWSVAIDGDTAVIGAHGEDHQAGAVYAFELSACLCPADLDGDSTVGILDLLALLAAWGPNPGHHADVDSDGTVDIFDLLTLLASWGPCP